LTSVVTRSPLILQSLYVSIERPPAELYALDRRLESGRGVALREWGGI
jgi:hypothetical protein